MTHPRPLDAALTRCAPTHLTARRISTYTVLGFTGYVVANVVGSILATSWGLGLGARLIVFFAPALVFVAVVTISSVVAGHERVVFYQASVGAMAVVAGLGLVTGADLARLLDVTAIGIGIVLTIGRVGCHSVACCHGTPGRGVIYGSAHVAVGFWRRWSGRPLWPVQLIEAGAAAVLLAVALAASAESGRATLILVAGYAPVRFSLELLRGDGLRPYARGLSEAQWIAVATALACAVWRPGIATLAIAGTLVAAATVLVARRRRRELLLPPHLVEIDRVLTAASDGQRHQTSLGLAVSRHRLPDGRIDWILSADHVAWSPEMARRLAHLLWPAFELVPGRSGGVVHVLTAA